MATELEKPLLEVKNGLHAVQKRLLQMDKESGADTELAGFDAAEHLLEGLRLSCMATTFTDLKLAHKHGLEDKLWQAHVLINTQFRKVIQRLKGAGHAVVLRNTEKQYSKHLKTAQYFYKGFIERLSARYRLPALQRAAHILNSENLKVPDVIDARDAHLDSEVTLSCYNTLIHLGDLARYRMKQSRQKKHGPETALTYYGLAHDLMPDSGIAHHQMAVVLADEARDFEIVYHFYRAWAVKAPHPNVARNLTFEFRSLLAPSTQKAGSAAPDARQMFETWFVRLHAHLFEGETFTQQEELEREVLHRLEMLLKGTPDTDFMVKVVLINISAYDVAQRKIQKAWTDIRSQSCQFILRFNIRTILSIAGVMESTIQNMRDSTPQDTIAPSFGASLALFRLYMAWVHAYQKDIVQYKKHLDPYVTEMHRVLTRCLSFFVQVLSDGAEVSSAKYLLPEDIETVGLTALGDWPALQLLSTGQLKPRYDDGGVERVTPQLEMLARVYDVVDCAVRLVGSPTFPWQAANTRENGREVTRIAYSEESVALVAAVMLPSNKENDAMLPMVAHTGGSGLEAAELSKYDGSSIASMMANENLLQTPLNAAKMPTTVAVHDTELPAAATTSTLDGEEYQDADLNMELETYHRVENYLAPPESRPPQPARDRDESSYGMHTSTAEEIFAQLQPKSPTLASSTTKAFPSLPWDFVFTPTPYKPAQRGSMSSPTNAEGSQAFRGRSGSGKSSDGSLPLIPDAAWAFTGDGISPSSRRRDEMIGSAGRRDSLTQSSGHAGTFQMAAGESPLPNSTPRAATQGSTTRASRMAPPPAPIGTAQASNKAWGVSASSPLGRVSGYGTPGSSGFYSTDFSQHPGSSLPQVQSPRGLPAAQRMAAAQGLQQRGEQLGDTPYFPQSPAQMSPTGASSAGQRTPSDHWSNAATAWGRGTLASKDDPTHFRNTIRETGLMDDTRAYDRNALLSALKGGSKTRR